MTPDESVDRLNAVGVLTRREIEARILAPVIDALGARFGRDEIAAMRAFLDARKGRAVPFWLPSFQWDLALAEDIAQNQSGATIRWVRYKQQMWGTTAARRHLALWSLGEGVMDYCRITGATDPANYLTETLTLDPVAGRDYSRGQTVLSFLKLCRLDEDRIEVSVRDDGVGFDTAVPPRSAYGLVGMRFRVEAEGGHLSVVSAPGQGTRLTVTLPESPRPAA